VWASGDAYEPFVGRWSRRAAREFIAWLALAANSRWLDVGCGTGALTQTILTTAAPCEVLGVDPSEGFVAYARDHTQDSRAKFEVGNAQALPVANSMSRLPA
jgi:ubiquinone/menaquinone biosynthesis C-methylase UbiE